MRKLILNITLAVATLFGMASCGIDNYDEPESTIEGNITYNGQALQLPGTGGVIRLNAYQDGYALHSPFYIYVDQNGHFSAKVFNGTYKIIPADNVGPWTNTTDTLTVTVKGSTTADIKVTPYFLVSDFNCTLNGKQVAISFKVEKIINSATIDHATVCVGNTAIIDDHNNAASFDIPGAYIKVGANSFSQTLSDEQVKAISAMKKVNARLGLRASGASQSIFSQILSLK